MTRESVLHWVKKCGKCGEAYLQAPRTNDDGTCELCTMEEPVVTEWEDAAKHARWFDKLTEHD